MRGYDEWRTLITERAPHIGDICELTIVEWEELCKLSGTRRRRVVFGRVVQVVKEVAA